jgi:hypothetical protein
MALRVLWSDGRYQPSPAEIQVAADIRDARGKESERRKSQAAITYRIQRSARFSARRFPTLRDCPVESALPLYPFES